jgi:hypothetical protein
LPADVIERPESQSVDAIKLESNEEIKRIRIERFAGQNTEPTDGWKRYLSAIGAKVADSRRNDIENTKEALMKTPDGMSVLVCACPSTARVYALEVAQSVESCEQAQRWLWSESRHVSGLRKPLNLIGRS